MKRITAAQHRLDALFDAAELGSSCLVPKTPADAAALRRRVLAGEVVEPAPGTFARAPHWLTLAPDDKALHLMHALGEKHPTWTFCASSAALAWGLDVPHPLAQPVQAYGGKQLKRGGGNPCIHISSKPVVGVRHDGLRVVPFWDAVVETLLAAPFAYGLAVADSALRASGWSRDDLLNCLRDAGKGRHGIRRALITASHADGRAENGGESRARAFFIVQGFQLPDLQVEIVDPADPTRVYRVDFYWLLPDGRVIIGEFDGKQKYVDERMLGDRTTVDALVAERQRESHLTLAGCPVVRFTYDDLQHPRQLERLLAVAGVPRDVGAARAWREQWAEASPSSAR